MRLNTRGDECASLWRREDGVSGISSSFHAGFLVTVRPVKYGVSSLTDSSVSACTAIWYSVLAGTTEVKLIS